MSNKLSAKHRKLTSLLSTTAAATAFMGSLLMPNTSASATASSAVDFEEIVVTARLREESLQKVPDAVTAFTSLTIERAGIESVADISRMTPNLTFRDGRSFSSNYIFLSMRGVGNGQLGWPSVSYLVDGVPADSLDAITGSTLVDLERIEVLRGPQSALYGANAIAGAINVITKRPTNDLELTGRVEYARGNDYRASGAVSGPIVKDKLLFRVNGYWRDSDGLIESASNGKNLDIENEAKIGGRLLFTPTDKLTLDFSADYVDADAGSTYQGKIPSKDEINVFIPQYEPRRRLVGREDREFYRYSLRAELDLGIGTAISTTSYNKTNQIATSSVCWDDPDSPTFDADPLTPGSQVGCIFGLSTLGSSALPGETVDQLFASKIKYKTFTQDMRLESPGDQALRWMFGFSYLHRNSFNGFDVGLITAPADGNVENCATGYGYDPSGCGPLAILYPRWDLRKDEWWGVYGQISYDITQDLELTLAGRYDDQEYRNTQYTDRDRTAVIQVPDLDGVLVDTQINDRKKFQPKVQISYNVTEDIMTYLTWSKGFRAAYYNSGAFTLPEETTNYEAGLKSTFDIGDTKAVVNTAIFHIDYSDQQFSTIIDVPPFRVPITIPKTNIDGAELEASWVLSRNFTLSGSIGYLDADVADGTRSPNTPKWNYSLAADYVQEIINNLEIVLHTDWLHNGNMYLENGEQSFVPSKDFINLRMGLQSEHWKALFYINNLTNTREAPAASTPVGGTGTFVRYLNKPRQWGFQITVSY